MELPELADYVFSFKFVVLTFIVSFLTRLAWLFGGDVYQWFKR